MERPRNYADPAKTTYIPAGPLTFGIEYRHLQTDQGICIHVFGDLNGSQEEFLRFDCFERAPHYHYAWSTDDQYVALDTTAEGDPLHWTLDRLRTRLPAMLIRAGAGELARRAMALIGAETVNPHNLRATAGLAVYAPITKRHV
jgi:hypothetical protein